MLKFFRTYILAIALTVGALGYPIFHLAQGALPYLIFLVLLVGFSEVSWSECKPSKRHYILCFYQTLASVVLYYALSWYNVPLAEGLMVCVLCPTAAASTVLTRKLKGDSKSLTAYLLLVNITTVLFVPLFFPLIKHEALTINDFLMTFWRIFSKIFPLLLAPFVLAQLFRYFVKPVHSWIIKHHEMGLYIWSLNLLIVSGVTTYNQIHSDISGLISGLMIVGALILCVVQYYWGKRFGRPYSDSIATGQGLGQKNTIFAIWLINSYLNPVANLAPGIYLIGQNIYNAWQLARVEKGLLPSPWDHS